MFTFGAMVKECGSIQRDEYLGSCSMDSTESRWVFQDEDDSDAGDSEDEDKDDLRYQTSLDSDDENNRVQRLIRTGPQIDSFDVEALEVPGAQRNDNEVIWTL